jgi:hypothetical protein
MEKRHYSLLILSFILFSLCISSQEAEQSIHLNSSSNRYLTSQSKVKSDKTLQSQAALRYWNTVLEQANKMMSEEATSVELGALSEIHRDLSIKQRFLNNSVRHAEELAEKLKEESHPDAEYAQVLANGLGDVRAKLKNRFGTWKHKTGAVAAALAVAKFLPVTVGGQGIENPPPFNSSDTQHGFPVTQVDNFRTAASSNNDITSFDIPRSADSPEIEVEVVEINEEQGFVKLHVSVSGEGSMDNMGLILYTMDDEDVLYPLPLSGIPEGHLVFPDSEGNVSLFSTSGGQGRAVKFDPENMRIGVVVDTKAYKEKYSAEKNIGTYGKTSQLLDQFKDIIVDFFTPSKGTDLPLHFDIPKPASPPQIGVEVVEFRPGVVKLQVSGTEGLNVGFVLYEVAVEGNSKILYPQPRADTAQGHLVKPDKDGHVSLTGRNPGLKPNEIKVAVISDVKRYEEEYPGEDNTGKHGTAPRIQETFSSIAGFVPLPDEYIPDKDLPDRSSSAAPSTVVDSNDGNDGQVIDGPPVVAGPPVGVEIVRFDPHYVLIRVPPPMRGYAFILYKAVQEGDQRVLYVQPYDKTPEDHLFYPDENDLVLLPGSLAGALNGDIARSNPELPIKGTVIGVVKDPEGYKKHFPGEHGKYGTIAQIARDFGPSIEGFVDVKEESYTSSKDPGEIQFSITGPNQKGEMDLELTWPEPKQEPVPGQELVVVYPERVSDADSSRPGWRFPQRGEVLSKNSERLPLRFIPIVGRGIFETRFWPEINPITIITTEEAYTGFVERQAKITGLVKRGRYADMTVDINEPSLEGLVGRIPFSYIILFRQEHAPETGEITVVRGREGSGQKAVLIADAVEKAPTNLAQAVSRQRPDDALNGQLNTHGFDVSAELIAGEVGFEVARSFGTNQELSDYIQGYQTSPKNDHANISVVGIEAASDFQNLINDHQIGTLGIRVVFADVTKENKAIIDYLKSKDWLVRPLHAAVKQGRELSVDHMELALATALGNQTLDYVFFKKGNYTADPNYLNISFDMGYVVNLFTNHIEVYRNTETLLDAVKADRLHSDLSA